MNKRALKPYIYFILLLASIGMINSSCTVNDQWDSYYSDQRELSAKNIWNYLQSNGDYSKFSALLKKTGLDKELSGSTNLTLVAVKDENLSPKYLEMDLNSLTEEEVNQLRDKLRIQLLFGEEFKYLLDHNQRISTYRGKYIDFRTNTNPTMNAQEVELTNIYTGNGVIHHSKGIIPTYDNIYEKIFNLGSEYSMVQEYIKSFDEKIFDKDNSTPKFLNEDGNMVYDTVWIEKNTFLEKFDPRDEERSITAIIPSDQVIQVALDEVAKKVVASGGEMTEKLSEKMTKWCLKSIFYEGEPLAEAQDSYDLNSSADTRFWIEDGKQEVDRFNQVQTSNGLLYLSSKLYIPKSMFMNTFHFNPKELGRFHKEGNNEIIQEYCHVKAPAQIKWKYNVKYGFGFHGTFCTLNRQEEHYSITFPKSFTVIVDEEGKPAIEDISLIPGMYEIKVVASTWPLVGKRAGTVKMFFNGVQVGNVWNQNLPKYNKAKLTPISYSNFEVPEEWGTNPIEIKFEHIKVSPKFPHKVNGICVRQISFIPSKSNY
ncbi:fasciclin domain-containing protein [Prolixibacteraceae bacterium]|nr:fasciclin domain-containing protein [Prolixibacteraceae bacterium]